MLDLDVGKLLISAIRERLHSAGLSGVQSTPENTIPSSAIFMDYMQVVAYDDKVVASCWLKFPPTMVTYQVSDPSTVDSIVNIVMEWATRTTVIARLKHAIAEE